MAHAVPNWDSRGEALSSQTIVKNRYVFLADYPIILTAALGAFAARFDWRFYQERPEFLAYFIAALLIKPVVFLAIGMYRRYWQYASTPELLLVVTAVSASSVAMALFVIGATVGGFLDDGFSRIVVLNDWILTLALTGGLRLVIRLVHDSRAHSRTGQLAGESRRILIVGAGAAGTMVAREMRRNPQLGMIPAGFLDDDPGKVGKHIGGLLVFGDTTRLADVVRARRIDSVVIAMPAVRGSAVRAILEKCTAAGVKSQTIPGVFELLDGQVSVNRLRNVVIEDLLRRSPALSHDPTPSFVAGRVVLITGAGGSIGSELARQIANASPSRLVLLGHGENSIFDAVERLRLAFPRVPISPVIADIRDRPRLAGVFDRFKPHVVYHAAAHKHVPLMEENPLEAVTNNIIGTRNVVAEALRVGAERFALISSDKAVEPTSVMGVTKRVAESMVRKAGRESNRVFVVVRFGNVLGSRGSVVNTFKAQIERGGPVTVTHPSMTRFFMTIPEAVHLVIRASGIGKGGELFVLEMGEPVRIVDLATDLIKLSGLRPDEVEVVFTGSRPGEKLSESLFDPGMQAIQTAHPSVLQVLGPEPHVSDGIDQIVAEIEVQANRQDWVAVRQLLVRAVPDFGQAPRVATASQPDFTASRAGTS